MIRFRFSLMRVRTGSALSRKEEEINYSCQGGQQPDEQLTIVICQQQEEGTPAPSRQREVISCILWS